MPECYPSKVVREVCGISARQLDYWIERRVIRPSRRYVLTKCSKRHNRLFSFQDLVQIRIVKSLRDSGVSLKEIGRVLELLREKYQDRWQCAWLVVFDGEVCLCKDGRTLQSLAKKSRDQLVFPVIAIGDTKQAVVESLKQHSAFEKGDFSQGSVYEA